MPEDDLPSEMKSVDCAVERFITAQNLNPVLTSDQVISLKAGDGQRYAIGPMLRAIIQDLEYLHLRLDKLSAK